MLIFNKGLWSLIFFMPDGPAISPEVPLNPVVVDPERASYLMCKFTFKIEKVKLTISP